MTKKRINIEKPLNSKSPNIIWSLIGRPEGLAKWVADEVKQDEEALIFTWGDLTRHFETRIADILEVERNQHLKFRWRDEEPDTFIELKIDKSEITGDYILSITDFANDEDIDTLHDLWEDNLERLHHSSGL